MICVSSTLFCKVLIKKKGENTNEGKIRVFYAVLITQVSSSAEAHKHEFLMVQLRLEFINVAGLS